MHGFSSNFLQAHGTDAEAKQHLVEQALDPRQHHLHKREQERARVIPTLLRGDGEGQAAKRQRAANQFQATRLVPDEHMCDAEDALRAAYYEFGLARHTSRRMKSGGAATPCATSDAASVPATPETQEDAQHQSAGDAHGDADIDLYHMMDMIDSIPVAAPAANAGADAEWTLEASDAEFKKAMMAFRRWGFETVQDVVGVGFLNGRKPDDAGRLTLVDLLFVDVGSHFHNTMAQKNNEFGMLPLMALV